MGSAPIMFWPFTSAHPDASIASAAQRLRRRRRRRPAWWAPFTVVTLLLSGGIARATSVVPPSFSELVSEAQVIARATVTDVSARWVDAPQGRVIKTFVTFAVEKRLKGEAADSLTLSFLGGTVGADRMHVSGMPEFAVGETEILFVQGNGVQFCPLVRFGHGRYHVRADAGTHRKVVTRNDDAPLTSTDDVHQDAEPHGNAHRAALSAAMTSNTFESSIADEVARHSR